MTDRRPFLVGESPSRTGDRYHAFPLSGKPARVLCECAGWEPDGTGDRLADWTWALYDHVRTINVFARHAEATPWSARAARVRAGEIAATMHAEGATVAILLGRKVADAFDHRAGWYCFAPISDRVQAVAVPHPSGRNLVMNDAAARASVGRALRQAVDFAG